MQKIISLLFALLVANMAMGQVSLSDKAEISLLTCAPGEEVYLAFGHSAILVSDPEQGIAVVYNYGSFDFDTPNFYGKFMQGFLNYKLSRSTFGRFMQEYMYEERSVRAQLLNLTAAEKQRLFNYLENNYLPENRYYLYDFFLDNCATRIRDAFEQSLADQFAWQGTPPESHPTYRDLLSEYLAVNPWADFGITVILGAVIDRPVTESEATFLPDYLAQACSSAAIGTGSEKRHFVLNSGLIYESPNPVALTLPFFLRPIVVLGLFAGVFLVFSILWRNKGVFFADYFLLAVVGLVGVLVAFLWFLSQHHATAWNWNILWASPWHLLTLALLPLRNKFGWIKIYMVAVAAIAVLSIVLWPFIPQTFHIAALAPALAVAVRLSLIALKMNGKIA